MPFCCLFVVFAVWWFGLVYGSGFGGFDGGVLGWFACDWFYCG